MILSGCSSSASSPSATVLGGFVVYSKLNPWLVSIHMLLSLAMVVIGAVLYHHSSTSTGRARGADVRDPPLSNASRVSCGSLRHLVITGTGATGSGPHSGATQGQLAAKAPAVRIPPTPYGYTPRPRLLFMAWWLGCWCRSGRRALPGALQLGVRRLVIISLVQAANRRHAVPHHVPAVLVELHVAGAVSLHHRRHPVPPAPERPRPRNRGSRDLPRERLYKGLKSSLWRTIRLWQTVAETARGRNGFLYGHFLTAALFPLNHPDHYFHWHVIEISAANAIVIRADGHHLRRGPAASIPRSTPSQGEPVSTSEIDRQWTTPTAPSKLRQAAPGDAAPDTQPSYVSSWIYVFGVTTISALIVVIATGCVLAIFGPRVVARLEHRALRELAAPMERGDLLLRHGGAPVGQVLHGRMARWTGHDLDHRHGPVLASVVTALTGYVSQTNFDSQ